MKVPLSWLGELVEIDVPLTELRTRLTLAGLEVEDVQEVGADWRGVTIGRVVDLQSHPQREALKVAQVDLGGRTTTVVTGATNLQVGDIVSHVAVGGRIVSGEVGQRDFGGVRSEGMMLSGDELGISPDKETIYVFEAEAPIGQSVRDFLAETVLDIYITANRPDCMSMMGIAREVHALFGVPYAPAMLRLLDPATARVQGSPGERSVSELLRIGIEDPVGCPRFTASIVRNIQIGPSPAWVQRRLHLAGVRPISNVVDVTNYVMLEVGQPLHAFDRHRLGSDTMVVRRARPGERMRTLDGVERVLTPEMMLVTDGEKPRSLAGIMGGEDSEITDTTRDAVLEGANWDRASIRRAAAALNLSSEASRRFGRGVDPALTALGVARATTLTLEIAGGSAAQGLADEYPGREEPRSIGVRPAHIEALLGVHFTAEQILRTLYDLGFQPVLQPTGVVRATVPGWRRFDVEGRADLAEEVGRVAGFDLVPSTMLRGALPALRPDGDGGYADELHARRVLAAAGLQEVITYSLLEPSLASEFCLESGSNAHDAIPIANPQSVEQSVLRPSLLASLLAALRTNLRQRDRVLLYELARTWHGTLDPLPDERRHIGIAMAGPRHPRSWAASDEPLDFFDLKGVVDTLCSAFRVAVSYAPARHTKLHPGRTAEVCLQGTSDRLAILGQLHPAAAEQFDLDGSVFVAELDFERLLEAGQPFLRVKSPSRYPPADRDIAIVVDDATPHADIEATVREAGGALLESVRLFDIYRGGSIPAGRKSVAFALRYRAMDRTLEDEEVSAAHARVEDAMRARFGAEVRGR